MLGGGGREVAAGGGDVSWDKVVVSRQVYALYTPSSVPGALFNCLPQHNNFPKEYFQEKPKKNLLKSTLLSLKGFILKG
jgi:hypothetical protein